jgi:hypothetical protein
MMIPQEEDAVVDAAVVDAAVDAAAADDNADAAGAAAAADDLPTESFIPPIKV